jgi:hypothetical protein
LLYQLSYLAEAHKSKKQREFPQPESHTALRISWSRDIPGSFESRIRVVLDGLFFKGSRIRSPVA